DGCFVPPRRMSLPLRLRETVVFSAVRLIVCSAGALEKGDLDVCDAQAPSSVARSAPHCEKFFPQLLLLEDRLPPGDAFFGMLFGSSLLGLSLTPAAGYNGPTGAVTSGDGTLGVGGTVSANNSLMTVASSIVPLSNSNYVVDSPDWNGGLGAVTWGN